jgi:pyrimidine operon attenuation protein / uracil phosphoribosyltransferase
MSTLVLDAEALYTEFLAGVCALYRPGMRLVGVTSGGAWLAERLHKDMNLGDDVGVISSSLHRDDFAQRGMTSAAQTQIGFDVNGADIILLDDVLHTGRTIRAVLNELFDFGRPASVKLAVLVDRSGHQLPIQADYFAARVALSPRQSLALARSESGVFSFNVKER